MKRILSKYRLTSFRLFLQLRRQDTIPFFKFGSIKNLGHTHRRSFRLCRRLVLPSAISFSARSMLATNCEVKNPRPAAKRSNRSAFNSTRTLRSRFTEGLIVRVSMFIITLILFLFPPKQRLPFPFRLRQSHSGRDFSVRKRNGKPLLCIVQLLKVLLTNCMGSTYKQAALLVYSGNYVSLNAV